VNFARVVGRVVATRRAPNLTEPLLLLLQPLDEDLRDRGLPLVAVSPVSAAGRGELVYYVSGSDATGALDNHFQPVDAAVVGFVDGYAGARLPASQSPADVKGEARGPGAAHGTVKAAGPSIAPTVATPVGDEGGD